MESYVGTKIIGAEPMTDHKFGADFRPLTGTDPLEAKDGYHVQYSQPGGGVYDSWSPKDVFEASYRRLSDGEKELINS